VPDTLLEAEFFGVAPGAYTGADRKGRDGKFKLADGGTLFLDEIGDMPLACRPSCCARCRRARSSRWARNKLVPFDVRIIAATSRDLARWCARAVPRGPVLPPACAADPVPPLRERRSDIPALIEVLGEDMALRNGTAPPELRPTPWRCWRPALARQHPRAAQRAGAGRACAATPGTIDAESLAACCAKSGWSLVPPRR
jgi:transcriptional regulator with GAF, ATPase, and Fis domain